MVNLYKIIVLFSYLIYVTFFFVPYLDVYLYDQDIFDVLSWAGFGALLELNEGIAYLFLLAYTVTLYGLIYFKAWARPMFLGLTLLSIIFRGIQGVEVFTPVDGVLSYITNLADGATIVLMYFTSINSRFSENA